MNVKINLPGKVKSRKVNKYVELMIIAETFEKKALEARTQLGHLSMTMTGGQLGEAKLILTKY